MSELSSLIALFWEVLNGLVWMGVGGNFSFFFCCLRLFVSFLFFFAVLLFTLRYSPHSVKVQMCFSNRVLVESIFEALKCL